MTLIMENPDKIPPQAPTLQDFLHGSSGPGHLYLRIIHHDSFGPANGWEVRDLNPSPDPETQPSIAYAARSQLRGSEHWALDFWEAPCGRFDAPSRERINISPAIHNEHMHRLAQIRIPLLVPYVPMAVADGCTFHVSIFGAIQAAAHFNWRKGRPPKGWEPLQLVIEEMLDAFQP